MQPALIIIIRVLHATQDTIYIIVIVFQDVLTKAITKTLYQELAILAMLVAYIVLLQQLIVQFAEPVMLETLELVQVLVPLHNI